MYPKWAKNYHMLFLNKNTAIPPNLFIWQNLQNLTRLCDVQSVFTFPSAQLNKPSKN